MLSSRQYIIWRYAAVGHAVKNACLEIVKLNFPFVIDGSLIRIAGVVIEGAQVSVQSWA